MSERAVSTTSTARVYDYLRRGILDGDLVPGERLRAEGIAERLGTSRTPVREALFLLEREGLVDLPPHKGAVVRSFLERDLVELYELRVVIEGHAARCAALRASDAQLERLDEICAAAEALGGAHPEALAEQIVLNETFHGTVLEAAGSSAVEAAVRGVADIPRAFRRAFWATDEQREHSLFCHRQLVVALRARDADLAEAVMRMHLLSARRFIEDMSDRDRPAGQPR